MSRDDLPKTFDDAAAAARKSPGDDGAWDALEQLAGSDGEKDEVATIYREVLAGALEGRVGSALSQRAFQFHEEWYGEDSPKSIEVLRRALELDSVGAVWAFQRLTVIYTSAERWDDLLALYDAEIERAKGDDARRATLLEEAVQTAKDFASAPDRAIDFLRQLLPLRPHDAQLSLSLERLLERQSRWDELVTRWREELETAPPARAKEIRLRIASVWLDRANAPGRALEELRPLMRGDGVPAEAVALLERIGDAAGGAEPPVGREALRLLRTHYDQSKSTPDSLRVLDREIALTEGPDQATLHRESANRWLDLGKAEEALAHFAAALGITPGDDKLVARMADVAEAHAAHARFAELLTTIADSVDDAAIAGRLRFRAADLRASKLGDSEGAITLYCRIAEQPDLDAEISLRIARRLAGLYGQTGRAAEQLDALERASSLEQEPAERRRTLGELARLARAHGAADRAIAAWRTRLEHEATDRDALDALIDVLAEEKRHEELVAALRHRVASELPAWQRRADRVRIAKLQAGELRSASDAIETWLEVAREHGEDPEVVDALTDLYAITERYDELADLLENAGRREDAHLALLRARQGDAFAGPLRIPSRAVAAYKRALESDPRLDAARLGLAALAQNDAVAGEALRALARSYTELDEWERWLSLLETLLPHAKDDAERVAWLRNTAQLEEARRNALPAALAALSRALPLAPFDADLESEVTRLSEATGDVAAAADAFARTADAASRDAARVVHLRLREADLAEKRLGDLPRALSAYAASLVLSPDRSELVDAVVRCADKTKSWDVAEQALVRAAERATAPLPAWRALVRARRATPGRPLLDALLRVGDLDATDLDALHEAVMLAREKLGDFELALALLARLHERASGLFRRGARASGEKTPAECVRFAADALVDAYETAGRHREALSVLLDTARLPIDPASALTMRRRAAALAAGPVGDRALGIDLYRDVTIAAPDDAAAFDALGTLLEAEGRLPEVLNLRRRELAEARDPERRLALRLSVAELVGQIEAQGGRLDALRANLEERPGHRASLDALEGVFRAHRRFGELADILTIQAAQLDGDRAAELWWKVARLATESLDEPERALDAYRRVAELRPNDEVFAALASLHSSRNEHAAEARWLERRLSVADERSKAAIGLSLARALLAAGRVERVVTVLEEAFERAPEDRAVRDLLAERYRADGSWAPLARLLTRAAEHEPDSGTVLALVREAADLYCDRLGTPADAIPVLRKGAELAPEDREVRLRLADGLREAGQPVEARRILEGLIDAFGRRRSPERADVHFRLGRVLRDQGDLEGALEQIEQATKMAMASPAMQQTFARYAHEAGQLERAEKAYRTLLMVVRRQSADQPLEVGSAEVLHELAGLARARGDEDQAKELLASALEASISSDAEALRFAEAVGKTDPDLAKTALERRLATVEEAEAKGKLLAALAELLAGPLGQASQAFDRRLEALRARSQDERLHEVTLAQARQLGLVRRYVDLLEQLVDGFRRDDDSVRAADLLFRLGRVLEEDVADHEAAADRYRRAEQLGGRSDAARLALARLYARLGRSAELLEVLEALSESKELDGSTRADVFYRLAEARLGAEVELGYLVEAIEEAFDLEPRHERAAELVARASQKFPGEAMLLSVDERIARTSGDERMLLDYLERRASRPRASFSDVREAADRASTLGETARAEALLQRALSIAKATEGGMTDVRWTLRELAERSAAAGEVPKAIKWMREAIAEAADDEEGRALRLRLAEIAGAPGGDPKVAAATYEELLADEATDPRVWHPLLRLYRRIGDEDRLSDMVARLVDALLDPEARNVARMELASHLAGLSGREPDAVDVLKIVLDEQPDHAEAASMLAGLYERAGYDEDLAELLYRQLDVAREGGDPAQVEAVALRLGALLERVRKEDALDVYRRAVEWAPGSRKLAETLLVALGDEARPQDRAWARERLLATARGAEASRLAREVYAEWEDLVDPEGMQRALELGYRGAPEDAEVRDQLEVWYRGRSDSAGLARFLSDEAARIADEDGAAALTKLREAASLYREELRDPRAAIDVLRRARERSSDPSILGDLVASLEAAGELGKAADEVTRAIDEHPREDAALVELLRLRARLRVGTGRSNLAVEDLERAFALGGRTVVEDLVTALMRRADSAAVAGERDARRASLLRLVDVHSQTGDPARAREALTTWLGEAADDVPALERLRDMDVGSSHWEGVAWACERLVHLLTGEDQVEAAMQLVDAAEALSDRERARAGLERARAAQPGHPRVIERLRLLYEEMGAHRELADLLWEEANGSNDKDRKFELFRRIGRIFVENVGDADAGLRALQAAQQLRPDDHRTNVLLADALLGSARYEEAASLLEQSIERYPKKRTPELGELQFRMAVLARAAGDRNIEMQWLNAALETDKNNMDVASALAELAMELGDHDVALNALRAITLSKTDGPMSRAMAFLLQARIAHQRGESRRALLWARKAKSEDPNLQEATSFLAELGES